MDIEADLDRKEARRIAADERALVRLDKQLAEADALIGILNSGTHYINIKTKQGVPTGRIKTGSRHDLISYLIRNRYV